VRKTNREKPGKENAVLASGEKGNQKKRKNSARKKKSLAYKKLREQLAVRVKREAIARNGKKRESGSIGGECGDPSPSEVH